MSFVPMLELMTDASRRGYAVPAFTVWDADIMQAVLNVAERLRSPVILMNGPAEFNLLSPRVMGNVARAVAEGYSVRAALHLDHGDSIEQVRQCLDAGYTSVMLDFSSKPFDENVAALREAVALARPKGVTVEGEIGAVGRIDNVISEGGKASTLTEPAEAQRYAEATGVDVLAVSIGNAHGNYTALPQFDFPRLAAIREAVSVPLVLHGGSGTPDEDVHRAISLGIAKINVASALTRRIRESLEEQWRAGRNLWLPMAYAEAARAVEHVIEEWIVRVKADGKA